MSIGISLVIPMLNESAQLPELLEHLLHWQRAGCEILLVDGGSTDQSPEQAEALGFKVLRASKGRALQMNAGAQAAKGDILVFLHADTRLPAHADLAILQALREKAGDWGRFDVSITGHALMLRVIAWFMNHRSRLSGIVTGDQAIFIKKSIFNDVGGFPEQALMEDIELSKRLKRISKPHSLSQRVTTSGRRWEQRGIWKTIYLMWRLRFLYWRGASADQMAAEYR